MVAVHFTGRRTQSLLCFLVDRPSITIRIRPHYIFLALDHEGRPALARSFSYREGQA